MGQGHGHHGPSIEAGQVALVVVVAVVVVYWLAARRLRRRGDPWPRVRDGCVAAGGIAVAGSMAAIAVGGPFTGHMVQHLLVGMVAPLLMVLGRPVTLALRVLGPGRARRAWTAVAAHRLVRWGLFPPVAAAVNVGGLWVLYRTPLLAAAYDRPWGHAWLHIHLLAAGMMFTFAICQVDPVRPRWGTPLRGATLLVAGAGHAVLAKSLYAAAPPGTAFAAGDLQVASQVMYYGGDLVELALGAVLAVQWYQAQGRAWRHARRRLTAAQGLPPVSP